jgi:hypothetical protein
VTSACRNTASLPVINSSEEATKVLPKVRGAANRAYCCLLVEADCIGPTWHISTTAGRMGIVIPLDLAIRLRDAGLVWQPAAGDRFAVPDRDLDDEVFVLANMVIQVHNLPDATVIGFNGTTEWALDDVDREEAIWLPREDQLRELLGPAFHRLEHTGDGFRLLARLAEQETEFSAPGAEAAYGMALLRLLESLAR